MCTALGTLLVLAFAAGGGDPDPDSQDTIRKSEASDGVNLCVEFTKEQAAGSPFVARFWIENERTEPVGLDQISHYRVFEITILDHEGKVVPFTRFGKRLLGGPAWRGKTRQVRPGASFSRHYNLARLFDLSEAGEYRITIRKKIHLERRRTITLEIKDLPLSVREPSKDDWARWRDDG